MKLILRNTDDKRTDDELLAMYRKEGNLEILGTLYNRYIHNVYGLCLKYLKDRDDSKDAAMQIFEVLIADIPKFEIRNFKSWLYVVSKNYCFMKLRKNSSDQKKMSAFQAENFMESTQQLHPLDEDTKEPLLTQLKECMEKLKKDQKECVERFYYQQKCYKEISEEMHIDEMKVKSYIQNGKRNLKICIEQNTEKNEV